MQVCLYKTEAIFTSMSATWYYKKVQARDWEKTVFGAKISKI